MAWRVAEALLHLRTQVNAKWPNRSKNSDGTIGDANHASRSSDHNPWVKDGKEGVVTAMDLTHDPAGGFDSYAFADMLLKNRDPRIKYVISNRRIGAGTDGPQPWQWRPYNGANPHDHHVHISVKSDKAHYDDVADWKIDTIMAVTPAPQGTVFDVMPRTVREGDSGAEVTRVQTQLNKKGYPVVVTNRFDVDTDLTVKIYQSDHGLEADGIVGAQTWKKLLA